METTLYRTATGGRRHIRQCPHLLEKEVVEAREDDGEVCTLCERELRGEGRRYFPSVAEALHEFGAPRGNWSAISRYLAGVEHDAVWIPSSSSYIALGRAGRAVAWAGRTYVEFPGGRIVELPGFRPGSGGGVAVERPWGDVCDEHHLQRSRAGSCGMCD